ncbi:SpaH/EbpB family LPXTG-anchored major pilin [Microbacterium sp. Leaf320]|uniref:SpaH/EbpB family LPXTG-anchored major pilin n=1 Tax=Microbacterium sp. Leaf320 TaxID=1736334 RepID=UPI0006F67524|nr:SpaH/EbpB family LPXTG-anchored major pilin [Microbacterium sp. Leaf320]KQQ65372.1 fimbrial protein [Microbacterium sp. Leaf320]
MNTPTTRRWHRLAATAVALAAAALSFATPATAANVVDAERRGSLTIHKYDAPVDRTGLANNGTEQQVALDPLAGVGFTVYKVDGIDLTTNSGWTDTSELYDRFDGTSDSVTSAGYTLSASRGEQLTNTAGEIALTDLDLGLYFVVETSPLPGATAVSPFLVTIPLTDPDNLDAWLYDVHVYPKNALTGAVKDVDDASDVQLGDELVFTITTDIPNVDIIDGYKVVDDLDDKLDYQSTRVTLDDGTVLQVGTHYDLTPTAPTAAGPVVEVVFTSAGRELLAANTDLRVVTEITTTVNTIGEIANTALLYPNAPSFSVRPGEPGGPPVTPEVVTKWGEITIQKTTKEAAPLQGAVFSVYTSEADARAGENPLSLAGATTFAVGEDGTLTLSGLRYSGWANNAEVSPGEAGYQQYWLVEVVAPSGYEKLSEPIPFEVTAQTTAVGIDLDVVNVKSNGGFPLPLTGGAGTVLFIVGGVAVLVGVTILTLRTRRRASAATE